MRIEAYGATDHGRRRAQNQDSILCHTLMPAPTPIGLYAVADGMGGQSAGEIASSIAIDTVREELGRYLEQAVSALPAAASEVVTARLVDDEVLPETSNVSMVDVLASAIQLSNQRVRDHGQDHPETAGLGSTLTVAMVTGNLALIGNIGDSRTYMVRDGAIRSLTQDHSLVGSLVRQGLITENDIYSHPHRNLIYNALGTRADANADIAMERLQEGDILVLCSDGLWEMVRDDEIRAAVQRLENPQDAARALVDLANSNGGVDNISVVIVRVA